MITVRLKGGMGNQMFQYAFARAIAERNHDMVVIDAAPLLDRTPRPDFIFRGYDLDIFNIEARTRLTLFSRCALRFPVPVLWAGLSVITTLTKSLFGAQKFIRQSVILKNGGVESMPRSGDLYLDGAWQGEEYFASIAPIIRREFTLREALSARAQKLLAEIQTPGVESIGVNVRRGDFVTVQRSMERHGFVGVEYYKEGMKMIGKHAVAANTARVYVFSDEIEWCRENLKFPGMDVTYVGHDYAGKKFGEYLQLLAACRHFIIPNSSFAWWAAWLGGASDKVVVAPKRWFADGAPERGVVPSTWLRV